ncbi:MAG: trypsin-like peptidase domain-containing protein [Dehalococcoidia bacterium]
MRIYTDNDTLTGVIIDKAGYVVTSAQRIGGGKIEIELKPGSTRYEGILLCTDYLRDIAVIKIKGNYPALQPAPLGDSDLVQLWDDISVVAYLPSAKAPAITKGTITGFPDRDKYKEFQASAALDPGSAGGAVVNKAGEIIGTVGWDNTQPGREGFVLAINEIKSVLSEAQDCETNPLYIDTVSHSDVFNDHAVISWKTSKPSTSLLEYGLTVGAYPFKAGEDATLLADHSMVIQNLQPKTTYHYHLKAVDVCGNEAVSSDGSFTTAETGVMPGKLTVTNISVYDITSSDAWVSWITNKPANSSVSFTADKSSENQTQSDSSMVFEHKIHLDRLGPQTRYFLSVKSDNEYGESAQQDSTPFTTLLTAPVCCKINCRIPDFSFKTLNDTGFSNGDIAGKRVILVFVNTECGICTQQALILNDYYENGARKDVTMFLVTGNPKISEVIDWAKKYALTVPIYIDPTSQLASTCQLKTIPSWFVLDTGSVIRFYKNGGFGSVKEVDEALQRLQ